VNSERKPELGGLLVLVGTGWLFFVIIWMPPLSYLLLLLGALAGVPDKFYGQWMLWLEVALAAGTIVGGVYLLVRYRRGKYVSQ